MYLQGGKKYENNGSEEIGLVTPIPERHRHTVSRAWIVKLIEAE